MFSDLGSVRTGETLEVSGDEAHHAIRVKRLRVGERVGVLDGEGLIGTGSLDEVGGSRSKPLLRIGLRDLQKAGPMSPSLEVWAALPKGDRLDRMIDQLTQIGVTRFRPLMCEHAQRKPESVRFDKLGRIVEEAMKQSRRAWRLDIAEPIAFDDAIRHPGGILADASGGPWDPTTPVPDNAALIVGPEGGWSNTERAKIVETDSCVCRFGTLVMRIETAAVAGASVLMNTPNPA